MSSEKQKKIGPTVREFVMRHPGSTASHVANRTGFRVSSVSSHLNKECKAGRMRKEEGLGSRGGAGFFIIPKYEQRMPSGRTAWERLSEDLTD